MEKMLVTQALDERGLLVKRIKDAVDRANFIGTKKPGAECVGKSNRSVEDFEKDVRSTYQSIQDLIDRYRRLDAAILLSNATTEIEVAGEKMTRAAAINLRKTIIGDVGFDFEGYIVTKMKRSLAAAQEVINASKIAADRQRESMSNGLVGSDKHAVDAEQLASINTYCDAFVQEAVDPINLESKIAEISDYRDELKAGLESAIKISNATTYVEF